ncbi:cyanophycinase [Streptomyces sp. 3330]|uniref:cyanophycinase n=1 Tax=Streptomyces sp. 3330 TaxID=2817755 RepID=UPI0028663803|nr:cyanophycinase [Streptomyces sp. 3330]MDR6980738.1 cyanophycinase [Streptomyces sp. 3330]
MRSRPAPRPLPLKAAAALLTLAVTGPLTTAEAAAEPAAPSPGHAVKGSLVLVGGGLDADNTSVYGEIIRRAGGPRARIGVITAASVPESQDPDADDPDRCSNSACNGRYYASLFTRHGAAHAEWLPIDLDHIDAADSDELAARVRSMSGFFFGGGDQYRYVTTLLHGPRHTDSKVLAAIRDKLAHGAVVAGTSAGAQIASGPDMVTGGESYQALRDGSAPGYFDDPARLGYLPAGGFGFLDSGLIDTHTGAQGREGRALRLAADTRHDRVYGLEEDTALVVDHPGARDERITVRGTHGLTLLDLRHAQASCTGGHWRLTGVVYHHLTDGDRYDPLSRTARPAPGKHPVPTPTGGPVPANTDVFFSPADPDGRAYSLLSTATALAEGPQRTATATTYESGPRFTVTLTEHPGRPTAWRAGQTGPTSITGIHLSVTPD